MSLMPLPPCSSVAVIVRETATLFQPRFPAAIERVAVATGGIDSTTVVRSALYALTVPPVTVLVVRLLSGLTVFKIAALTCATVHPGIRPRSSAATPVTWGAAIDVPLRDAYPVEPTTVVE